MPKSKQKQAWMSDFVQITVTKEHQSHLKDLAARGLPMSELLDELADERLKVTFRLDSSTKGIACWLQPLFDEDANAKMILVGHGRSSYTALIQAYYFHKIVFEGDWPQYNREEGEFFWEDIK